MVIITTHAYKRAKERLRWKKNVVNKMAQKAFEEGIQHKDTRGRLNKYITAQWGKFEKANNIRIYKENVFIFVDDVLLTVFRLPQILIKYAKHD